MLKTAALAGLFAAAVSASAPKPRQAPQFSLPGSDGKTYALSDFKGKFVVLEWFNKDCPFVKKHYGSGNMQALQREFTGKGVIWLSIVSSAPGKQGCMDAAQGQAVRAREKSAATALLLDSKGAVGRLYGAKTTPHMFVIDPRGRIVYQGAIDDAPTSDPADIPKSRNYVRAALGEAMAGKPVTVSATQSYGCSVKY